MISICLVKHVQLRTFLQIVIKSQCQNLWKQLTQTFPREWRTWTVDRYKPKFGHLRWILFAPKKCDQIARFLKVLGDKIFNKSSQNERQLFVQFCKTSHSFVKTVAATVWATFGNVWATFYSNVWSQWRQINKQRQTKILITPVNHWPFRYIGSIAFKTFWEGRKRKK